MVVLVLCFLSLVLNLISVFFIFKRTLSNEFEIHLLNREIAKLKDELRNLKTNLEL